MLNLPLVYFVRHGQTDWNAEGRLQGQTDTDLNDRGRGQASRNGALLKQLIPDPADFDFVASPLRRTRETMERVRAAIGLQPSGYRTDARLMELHYGGWEGSTFAEIEGREPGSVGRRDRDKWNFLPPGEQAESYEKLLERAKPWIEALAAPTVCVTHGGIVRVVFVMFEDMPKSKAAALEIPQDRVLKLENGRLEWLDSAGI